MAVRMVDYLAKAKKFHEVESIQHEDVQNPAETLENIAKFLQEHATPVLNDCTHMVFDNYQDWWMDTKPMFKLQVSEDNTLDTLFQHIATLYKLGIPLMLSEKQTPEIRFLQDVEIWGTVDQMVSAEELLNKSGPFLSLLGKAMREMFPAQPFLDVVVFDASGLAETKGVKKTSIRLVWPSIIVDKERACQTRDYVVHRFKNPSSQEEGEVQALHARLLDLSKDNTWDSVFGDKVYVGRTGVRMPLCDRVSPAPRKRPERRPFSPMGVVRFEFEEQTGVQAEWLEDTRELKEFQWVKIGHIRCDAGSALTEWVQPTWKGERAPLPGVRPTLPGGRSGQVRVRSKFGYIEYRTRTRQDQARQLAARNAENPISVERTFEGNLAEFREFLELSMRAKPEDFKEEEGRFIWQQANTQARVEVSTVSRKVFFIGKTHHQIRSLLTTLDSFVRTAGEAATKTSYAGSVTGSQQRAGSEFGGYTPSATYKAPLAVAPSQVYTPSGSATLSASGMPQSAGAAGGVSVRRTATWNFEPEEESELKITSGDIVVVIQDPQEGNHNIDRWVFGEIEATKLKGWFPLWVFGEIEDKP